MKRLTSIARRLCPALLLWTAFTGSALAQGTGGIRGVVTTLGPDGQPVYLPGTTLLLGCKGSAGVSVRTTTDETGGFSLVNLAPGKCRLTTSAPGFLEETKEIEVKSDTTAELNFQLNLASLNAEVKVLGESPAGVDTTTTSAAAPAISQKSLQSAPLISERFQDALPLLPGVVRGPDGLIDVKGARPSQSGTLVNSVSAVDPVTGEAAISLPIEAVESVKVLSNPFSAEYGRFAGGVTELETRSGTDHWKFLVTNFFPRLRRRGGHTVGLESITPRLTFAGPLRKAKLYIFQSFDYRFVRVPVSSLPPFARDRGFESLDSDTQIDWNITSNHHLTGLLTIYPQNVRFATLSTFNPQEVTPNFRQRGFLLSLNEHSVIGSGLLESSFSVKRYDVHVFPSQGVNGELNLFPEQNFGDWYNRQDRNSWLYQWSQTYGVSPLQARGQHLLTLGYSYSQANYDGVIANQPVVVLRENRTTSQRITFSSPSGLASDASDVAFFVQDHWSPVPRISLDFGARFDHEGLSKDTLNVAPRVGLVVAPTGDNKTALRGGIGLFFDKIPLDISTFLAYPAETIIRFAADGVTPISAPATFVHRVSATQGLRVPYSLAWSFQADREIRRGLMFRFGYEERRTRRDFFLQPVNGSLAAVAALQLLNTGRQTYREFQWTVRWQATERSRLFASYVHSRARGELNTFGQFFDTFPNPIIRANEFGPLPYDAPNRLLFWGSVGLPWKLEFWPVLDIHTGFPFSKVDDDLNFVGARNRGGRFPTFASFDFQLVRAFHVRVFGAKRELRAGFKVFNVTNHFNPRDVQQQISSPLFGAFFNSVGREYRAKLEFNF